MPPASPGTGAPRQGCSETLRVKTQDVRADTGPAACTVRSPPAPGPRAELGSRPGRLPAARPLAARSIPSPGGVSMGQQTPELHPNAHPPLSHLSLAAPGLQPGPRSGSAREGASLYCLSASLGTWPLSSQLEMEPVPPALGGWSLIHRTTREVPKKELFSAQVGCSLLPGLMCALLPHVAAGAPTAGSSETGCPPAQPHTATPIAPPWPGVADCDLRGSDAG